MPDASFYLELGKLCQADDNGEAIDEAEHHWMGHHADEFAPSAARPANNLEYTHQKQPWRRDIRHRG